MTPDDVDEPEPETAPAFDPAIEGEPAPASEEAAGSFFSLTPERVLAAVEASGLEPNPVCYPLNSYENRVYEIELEDRSRVVAKFYRPGRWSAEQIREEHAFLAELEAAELPVCPVRRFPDGETLHTIEHIHYSLADRRGGRAPDELDDKLAERLGAFVGRMHNVGAARPATARPRLDAERYVRRVLRWMDLHGTLSGSLKWRYFAAAETIADVAEELMETVATHRIHADLHLGNVLQRDAELNVLDFDDMVTGPAVQDLWLALPGRGVEADRLRELFLRGYERFRLFDRATLCLVEPLRGLRMVRYAGWLARRWDDPAFRAGWPHFGTDEYWQRETADLEEQAREVKKARRVSPLAALDPGFTPVEPEVEETLSNKDYFWDWEGD